MPVALLDVTSSGRILPSAVVRFVTSFAARFALVNCSRRDKTDWSGDSATNRLTIFGLGGVAVGDLSGSIRLFRLSRKGKNSLRGSAGIVTVETAELSIKGCSQKKKPST